MGIHDSRMHSSPEKSISEENAKLSSSSKVHCIKQCFNVLMQDFKIKKNFWDILYAYIYMLITLESGIAECLILNIM